MIEVDVAAALGCELGEGPTWDAVAGLARWVDVDRGALWQARITPDGVGTPHLALTLEPTLSAALPADDGGLLLARSRHVEHRDATGAVVGAVALIPDAVSSRLNDAACDPDGRLLVGSMGLDGGSRAWTERLWRVEHDGSVTVLDDAVGLSNGIGWSPDGSRMMHVDTTARTVWARDYDPTGDAVGERRALVTLDDAYPDGLAVDATGGLWLAVYGGGEIRHHAPTGELLEVIRTGAPLTTSCAFVGPARDLLLITTAARDDLDAAPSARSGAVLTARPGVSGLPTTPWRARGTAGLRGGDLPGSARSTGPSGGAAQPPRGAAP